MDIEHLYRDHHRWLVNWIYRRVSEGRDAEDLAQNTFMRILDKREPEVIQAPRPYLTTIARSLVSNFTAVRIWNMLTWKHWQISLRLKPHRLNKLKSTSNYCV